jgi:hypothetical protein
VCRWRTRGRCFDAEAEAGFRRKRKRGLRRAEFGETAVVTNKTFLIVAAPCLVLAAASLVAADVFNAPALAAVGCAAIVAVLVARESWSWRGYGKQWAATVGVIAAVMAVAFAVSVLM